MSWHMHCDSEILVIENECRVDARFIDMEASRLDTLQGHHDRIDSPIPSAADAESASVIGRIFAFRVLQAVHPIEADKPALYDCLETLTRLSLTLVESEAPDLAYVFKHALTQEVAYNLMLFSQRRQLHQAVAEWIEKNYEKNLEAYYTILAHHWSQAAETTEALRNSHALNKAVEYLHKAGTGCAELC
jgi:predicted ATPase